MFKIVIGSDHAAFDLVDEIISKYPNIEFINVNKSYESIDYSDVAQEIVKQNNDDIDYLVCICGTGFGITNSVLKFCDEKGLIIKHQEHINRIFEHEYKVIGFGARTTEHKILFDFFDQI